MSKGGTLFNPGKVLEVLENALTFFSIRLENYVERKLDRAHKRDVAKIALNKREKSRRKANIELAKSQDIRLEINAKDTERMVDRTEELNDLSQDVSDTSDVDRE